MSAGGAIVGINPSWSLNAIKGVAVAAPWSLGTWFTHGPLSLSDVKQQFLLSHHLARGVCDVVIAAAMFSLPPFSAQKSEFVFVVVWAWSIMIFWMEGVIQYNLLSVLSCSCYETLWNSSLAFHPIIWTARILDHLLFLLFTFILFLVVSCKYQTHISPGLRVFCSCVVFSHVCSWPAQFCCYILWGMFVAGLWMWVHSWWGRGSVNAKIEQRSCAGWNAWRPCVEFWSFNIKNDDTLCH